MAIVSRLKIDHPPLAEAGGTSLHTDVEDIYIKIGDNMDSRFFTEDALADTANVDFDHNFKCAFEELSFLLYLRNTGTGELTRINNTSTPPITDFDIEETPGLETTQIRVTNNSGAARDIALVLTQDGGASGAAGGGVGFVWHQNPGVGPVEAIENGLEVYKFDDSHTQKLSASIQVPVGFTSGTRLRLRFSAYSPSSDSSTWRFELETTHLRDGVDAVTSTTNQLTVDSTDRTSSSADLLQNLDIILTDTLGGVGAPLVSENDVLKIVLRRVAPGAGTEDTADIRMLRSPREIEFFN